MTEQIALTVSALGVVIVGVVLSLGGVTVRHRHLHFRSVGGSSAAPGSALTG